MPADKDPRQPEKDLASEIDKLLKKLPHADPALSGGRATPAAPIVGTARATRPGPAVPSTARPLDRKTLLGVWGRVALAGVLGLALTQWPLARECGWGLLWYCAAVGVLFVAAGWIAMVTWEYRVGLAHIVSLVVGFWAIVVSADVLLPRLGYSVDRATWRCRAPVAASPARATPTAAPIVASPVDSLAAPSTDSAAGLPARTDSVP